MLSYGKYSMYLNERLSYYKVSRIQNVIMDR